MFAPSAATAKSKLPVFVFIQGGGFNTDSNPNLNGTALVQAGDNSMIVVTFNYRVGPYGFLTRGADTSTNNGLRDQRKVLEWVQNHIAKFGGNPDHVVLGGDSAGAASVSLHLTAYNGRDTHLFHAAAAESVSFATVLTVDEAKYQYDNLAIRLGCAGKDSLACLRSKTAVELQTMNYNNPYPGATAPPLYMWGPVIDGDLITDLTYTAFKRGKFIKVPTIIGDDTNGGTQFTPKNTSSLAEGNVFLKNQFPFLTLEQLATLNDLYPNPNQTCPNVGCYWRQVSNEYGEGRYMCPGLYITSLYTQNGVKASYAYRWNVEDPAQIASGLGVPHTIELSAIFGPNNTNGKAPDSYYPGGINAESVPVIQGYWTSFIRTFDPNKYRYPGSASWLAWTDRNQQRLLFETGGVTEMEKIDAGLRERCDYWASIGVSIRQ